MLNEKTAKLLVSMKYEDKGINGVIELIDTIPESIETISINCGDQAWIDYIGSISSRLKLLDALFATKKLQSQREDLKEIGTYLKNLGQELINYEIKDRKDED